MRVVIEKKDLRRETFRSGGHGGQRQNKVETAVRYTHLPTGLVGEARDERFQSKNEQIALGRLLEKLREHYARSQRQGRQAAYAAKDDASFGRQARSYILCGQRRVIDHKTGVEHPRPEDALNGDIDRFLAAALRARASRA